MIRGWGLWCLMPLSTIFQLFHGSYSDWWQYIYVVLEIVCLKILLLFSPKILHMPPDQDFTETGIRSRFHKDWHQIKASQRLQSLALFTGSWLCSIKLLFISWREQVRNLRKFLYLYINCWMMGKVAGLSYIP